MKNQTYNCVSIHSGLKDKIDMLTVICKCNSKNELLEKIVNPIFEIASAYDAAELESYPLLTRGNVTFQLYGKPRILFAKNPESGVGHDD
jgi:hypothetical protein